MLEDAILTAKAEGAGLAPPREALSPIITVDAPILIPEDYVPTCRCAWRCIAASTMPKGARGLDAFAAEMIDRVRSVAA